MDGGREKTIIQREKTDCPHQAVCRRFNNRPDALVEIFHAIQEEEGYVSDEALAAVARALNLSRAEVLGVLSFYHDFRQTPPARHRLKICRAEACQARGGEALVRHAERKLAAKTGGPDAEGKVELEAVYCLGNCALGPALLLDGALYGKVTPERFDEIIAHCISDTGRQP